MILRALIRTRMLALRRSLLQRQGRRGKGMAVLFALLMLYALACMLFIAVMTSSSLCAPLAAVGLSWLYFAVFGLMAFTLAFFMTVFMAERQLFAARDNELLLSLPIPPRDILASRMAVLAVSSYFAGALVLIPAGIVYQLQAGFTAAGAAAFVLESFTLPLGALALACLLGQALAWLSARSRHKSLSSILATAVFLVVYMSAVGNGNRALALLVQNGEHAAAAIRIWAAPAFWFGAGAVGSLPAALAAILLPAAALALVWFWLARSFYRITTTRVAAPKVRYREKRAAQQSAGRAIWLCELRHFGATPGWVVNGGIGAVMAVLAGGALFVRRDALEQLFALPTAALPAAPMLTAVVCFCTGMCLICSASVSLQGKTLWLLQSCPVSGGTVLRSFAAVQLTLTVPATLLAVALGAAGLGLPASGAAAALVCALAYDVLTAYLGVIVNVCLPKFDWLTETQAVKQSASTMLAMLLGFALVGLPVALYALLVSRGVAYSGSAFLWGCTAVFAAGAALAARWVRSRGAARFAALE